MDTIPIPEVRYFADRCSGKKLVLRLKAIGINIIAHDDVEFAPETIDVKWITKVADRQMVILTRDQYIRRRFAEIESVITANARIITLGSGN
jgi:hypothetical protein